MRRFTALLLCLICTAALFGCGKKEPVPEPEALPAETANALVYDNGSTTLRFANNGDKWVWTDGLTFPLDDSTIRQILDELTAFFAKDPEVKNLDPAACGLAEPRRYLTVTSAEGSQTLYFSEQAPDGSWYMRCDGEQGVYKMPDSFMTLLSKNVYDMAILPTFPALTEENVTFIGVSRGEENQVYFLRTEDGWKSNGKDVTAMAQNLLKELAQIEILRCVDYFPATGVAELCGLTEDAVKATVKYTNSVGTESELTVTFGGESEAGEGLYATFGDSEAIYCLPKEQFAVLLSLL